MHHKKNMPLSWAKVHGCISSSQLLKIFSTLGSPLCYALSFLSRSFSPRCLEMSIFWTFHSILHSWETVLGWGNQLAALKQKASLLRTGLHSKGQGWGRQLGEFDLCHLLVLFSWSTKTRTGKSSQLITWYASLPKHTDLFRCLLSHSKKVIPLAEAGKTRFS